jgi:hypothetical protein
MKPKKTKWRRWLLVLMGFVVILPAMLVLNKSFHKYRLESKIAELRSAGQPTTWKELIDGFPKIPDDQNAAEIYCQAFEAFVEWDEVKTDYFPVIGGKYEPDLHKPLPKETWQDIAAYLVDNQGALDLLHQAAAQPYCQFLGVPTLSPQTWFSQRMGSFGNMRAAAKLLCLEAIFHAEVGDAQMATDALLAGFQLADAFNGVPLMIDWLVQVGCRNLVASKVERVVNTVQLSDDQIERLMIMLQAYVESDSLKKVWTAELGYTLAGLDEFYVLFGSPSTGWVTGDEIIYYVYDSLGLTEAKLVQYIDSMTDLIAFFQPFDQGTTSAMDQFLIQNPQLGLSESFDASLKDPLAVVVQAYYIEQRSCTHMATVLTGLAVERFQLVNQRLPSDLQDLAPSYIEKLPPDPYTGNPLKYKRRGEGYCVYSVGADCIDNGGRERNEQGRAFEPGSDIPFTVADPNER